MTDLQAKYQKLATEYSKVGCRWCRLGKTHLCYAQVRPALLVSYFDH